MGFWGNHDYFYLEVGGAEIANGAVVASWVTITRPDEFIRAVDPLTGEVTTNRVDFGVPYTQTETAECAVIYRDEDPTEFGGETYLS